MKYLAAEQLLFIHATVIRESGGAHGIRDIGLLEAAAGRPQATFDGRDLYPDVWTKAAALMESLVGNHPFVDGNKRTALGSAALFLRQNGFRLFATQLEIETFTLDIALKKIRVKDASAWLKEHSTGSP